MTIASNIDYMARVARETYVEERANFSFRYHGRRGVWGSAPVPRWDGGENLRNGRESEPFWPRLAQFALAGGVDVADLIRAQFETARGRPPEPTDCMNNKALRALAERQRTAHDRAAGELAAGIETLRVKTGIAPAGADLVQVVIDLIDNPIADLTPLFRAVLAGRMGQAVFWHRYLPAAVRQYATGPGGYDETWGNLIPNEIRQAYSDVRAWAGHTARRVS